MSLKLKSLSLTIIGIFAFVCIAGAQIPDEIIFSLKTGNAAKLAKHFSENVELVVLETENVYSKAHAQQVINDFFSKHKPQDFKIKHQGGGKNNSSYAIGTLKVEGDIYRVYFLLKNKNGKAYIHQLRIEKQNN